MAGYDDRVSLTVAGVGDYTTGDQYAWWTRLPESPAATDRRGLVPGRLQPGDIAPLEWVGASGSMTVGLVYDAGTQTLLDRRILWPGTNATDPPRLVNPLGPASTSMQLTQDFTVAAPFCVWFGGEVVRIDSRTAPFLFAITRGVMGTTARAHVWQSGQTGPVVLSQQPTPVGARVVVERNGDALYQGAVTSCAPDGSTISLSLTSAHGIVRQMPARRYVLETSFFEVVNEDAPANTFFVDAESRQLGGGVIFVGAPRIAYTDGTTRLVRVWWDKETWSMHEVVFGTSAVAVVIGTVQPAVLQWGVGPVAYPFDTIPGALASNEARVAEVELVPYTTDRTPTGLLTELLTAQFPPGPCMGLSSGVVDDLSVLDRALGSVLLQAPYCDLSAATSLANVVWPGPVTDEKTAIDWLSRGLAEPLGCGLAVGDAGGIVAVDWTSAFDATSSVGELALREPVVGFREGLGVREITVTHEDAGGERVVRYVSDFSQQVAQGGKSVEVRAGWLQHLLSTVLLQRMLLLLYVWQQARPETTVVTSRAAALTVGQVFELTCSTLPGNDGTRGVTDLVAMVTARSTDAMGVTVTHSVVLTGYGTELQVGEWAPTVEVLFRAGSTYGVSTGDYYDGPVTDLFTVGQSVRLLNPDGTVKDGAGTITAVGATSISVVFSPVGATGDLIILSGWDTVGIRGDYAWLADAAGALGTGDDPPFRYV